MLTKITFNYGENTKTQTMIKRYPTLKVAKRLFRAIRPNAHILDISELVERETIYIAEGKSYKKRKQRAADREQFFPGMNPLAGIFNS